MALLEILELVISYSVRVAPGLLVAAVFLILLPRRLLELRMFAYILAFILIRDEIGRASCRERVWRYV